MQFILMGLLGEVLARTYFESQGKSPYKRAHNTNLDRAPKRRRNASNATGSFSMQCNCLQSEVHPDVNSGHCQWGPASNFRRLRSHMGGAPPRGEGHHLSIPAVRAPPLRESRDFPALESRL